MSGFEAANPGSSSHRAAHVAEISDNVVRVEFPDLPAEPGAEILPFVRKEEQAVESAALPEETVEVSIPIVPLSLRAKIVGKFVVPAAAWAADVTMLLGGGEKFINSRTGGIAFTLTSALGAGTFFAAEYIEDLRGIRRAEAIKLQAEQKSDRV